MDDNEAKALFRGRETFRFDDVGMGCALCSFPEGTRSTTHTSQPSGELLGDTVPGISANGAPCWENASVDRDSHVGRFV